MNVVRYTLAVVLVGLVGFTGCDSGDPVTSRPPDEVAGFYVLTTYQFVPEPAAIAPADILDTLGPVPPELELLDGGEFQLRYQEDSGRTRLLTGTFVVTTSTVRLVFADNTAEQREALLLPSRLTLDRQSDDSFLIDQEATVNLEAFDPTFYAGLKEIDGTLTGTFVPR